MSSVVSRARLSRRTHAIVERSLHRAIGGPARRLVVGLLACVLALESADLTAIGAAAPQLEGALHISNAQLGLLAAISTLVGAVATLPMGVLTDRVKRVNLLAATLLLWAVAMAAGAAAQGFDWLLLSRIGLGAVTAAAGPVVASLTGDFFAAGERAKIYGYILSGELLGAGFGFVISGSIAAALSWRGAFAVLAGPALVLAFVIWRRLPEPARGGASRLGHDDDRIVAAENAQRDRPALRRRQAEEHEVGGMARRAVTAEDIEPVHAHVLRTDPDHLRVLPAIKYVLAVKTNRWMIAASAIGYFFFAGMRTFALVFVRGHFGISQSVGTVVLFLAGVGSLAAVLVAGRLADRLIRAGRLDARVLVAAVSYMIAAAVLAPAVLTPALGLALPLLMIGAGGLAAPNPPLDAARLDIMPARLWGRAEGVRTFLRQLAQAAAPVVFGLVADALANGHGSALGAQQTISPATSQALQDAFLIMLVPLAVSGMFLFFARRSYPRDVATAVASERAVKRRASAGSAS